MAQDFKEEEEVLRERVLNTEKLNHLGWILGVVWRLNLHGLRLGLPLFLFILRFLIALDFRQDKLS